MTQPRLEVEGLTESIKALTRVDRELGARARDLIRTEAVIIAADAKSRLGNRPGGGTYPRRAGMIRRKANQKGAEIGLAVSRYPWARGAEFGAKRAWVFGRVTTQGKLRRRQFPVWRGNQFVVRGGSGPGWVIQPAIRANIDAASKRIGDGLIDLFDEAFRAAGVPRG